MASVAEMLRSFLEMFASIVRSIVENLKYIPQLLQVVTLGLNDMLTNFNQLPQVLFTIGSVTLFIAFWFLIFGR